MTIAEIIAKIKADPNYDPSTDMQVLQTAAVTEATQALASKNGELLSKLAASKKITDTVPEEFTIEKWTELNKAVKDIDLSKLKTDEAVEAVKTQMALAHKGELDSHQKVVGALTLSLEKHMLDSGANSAITEAGGIPALLLPHVKSNLKMQQNDAGEYEVAVVDEKGVQRFSTANPGSYMMIPELVGELKGQEAYKPAFAAENSGGGAARRAAGGDGNNPWVKGSGYNLTEQAKITNTNPGQATQLQEAARQLNSAAAA